MKKILLIAMLLICIAFVSNAQKPISWAVYARGGYSWTTGVVGGEAQIGHVGLAAGWMPTKMPLSGEKISSVGMCFTVYSNPWYENGLYLYLGEATSGYRYEDSWGDEQVESMLIAGLGWKYGTENLDLKMSVGYGWCDYGSAWTGEITLGIPLFKHKLQ